MADVWSDREFSTQYRDCDTDAQRHDGYPEDDMDAAAEVRLRAVEMAAQRNNDHLDGHIRECTLRGEAVAKNFVEVKSHLKWLTVMVGASLLIQVGVASVQDIVRSGAARVGVTVQTAPSANAATR